MGPYRPTYMAPIRVGARMIEELCRSADRSGSRAKVRGISPLAVKIEYEGVRDVERKQPDASQSETRSDDRAPQEPRDRNPRQGGRAALVAPVMRRYDSCRCARRLPSPFPAGPRSSG